jgi:hypothetical protein
MTAGTRRVGASRPRCINTKHGGPGRSVANGSQWSFCVFLARDPHPMHCISSSCPPCRALFRRRRPSLEALARCGETPSPAQLRDGDRLRALLLGRLRHRQAATLCRRCRGQLVHPLDPLQMRGGDHGIANIWKRRGISASSHYDQSHYLPPHPCRCPPVPPPPTGETQRRVEQRRHARDGVRGGDDFSHHRGRPLTALKSPPWKSPT